jgi:glycosyltransferase involved in cell wall biosynthesis
VDDYYLFVGRLVPYRRLDLLVAAFNQMGRPLIIAGSGRDRERLETLAGPTVKFVGFVCDDDLPDLLARCRAFLWPGEEDFGIAPLNPMAAGRPAIAYAAGGALETVVPGETGALFARQTVAAIISAVEAFDPLSVNSAVIRRCAEQFDTAVFKRRIQTFVEQKLEEGKRP